MPHRASRPVSPPGDTFVEILQWRAAQQPAQRAFTFLTDGETAEAHLTYAQLDRQARAIGALLQAHGASGERALLLYPSGLEYVAALFGCFYAGAVAVPAYPPRFNRMLERLQAIAEDAQVRVVLTTQGLAERLREAATAVPALATLPWLATDTLPAEAGHAWQPPAAGRDTLALLQYTSGATGTPRGVMLSHGNLLHNSQRIQHAFGHTAASLGVSWLPLYHDMGLIGGLLQPVYVGFPCIFMSPIAFLQRPYRWLHAISRYRATTSGGPNFAYDLCVRKIPPAQRATLDLSCWEVAFNGAEPVRPETLERFAAAFAACGFRRQAFYPCYGLAEATLMVTGGTKTAPPVLYSVQKAALEHHRVRPALPGAPGSQTLVGCGRSFPDQTLLIVDPDSSRPCPPGRVGEIWVAGPSVAQGYWRRPQDTQATFQAYLAESGAGPFLRTGDLGFLAEGELFVTGRLKDVLIIRGSNHYPQDIERTVEQSHPALRPGCGAAFTVEVAGEERLVIVQEVERRYQPARHHRPERRRDAVMPSFEPAVPAPAELTAVIDRIRQAVAEAHGLQAFAIVLLRAGSIPKTSSGKVRRHACKEGFLSQTLEVVEKWQAPLALPEHEPPWPPRGRGHGQHHGPQGGTDGDPTPGDRHALRLGGQALAA